ncbi:MAG: C25 family cysteine peptidase [Pyrinomonadaceae bacterium]|nr:C25 family cysteine peptidase [Pyrinomonadaceae bacterium]MCX7639521.1 C25 family cysteine peptidase [Pyrinomonadaceae bacterium]MDW8304428.1 C25 family cysteine peptidase [Acidobacteriota bacterium]
MFARKILTFLIVAFLATFFVLNKESTKALDFIQTKAYTDGKGVWLEWQTSDEKNIVGFQIYKTKNFNRKEAVTKGFISSTNLIAGENPEWGRTYSYFDPNGSTRDSYLIEILYQDGSIRQTPRFRPIEVKRLEDISGYSSEELLSRTLAESNPYVYKENLEVPADIGKSEDYFSSAEGNFDVQRWIASQPGVKIGVKKDGLYRISRATLQSAGFDVNAPIEKWQLYTDGIEQAIRIAPNGDYVEFYGRGVNLNETDTRIYYLVVGNQNGKRMQTRVLRNLNSKVLTKSFKQTIVKKDNLFYLNPILNGNRSNFFGSLVSTSGGITTVNVPSIDFATPTVSIEISVQGYTFTTHQITVELNGNQIGTINGSFRELMTGNFTVPTSMLIEGTNTFRLISSASNSSSFTDEIKISYNRLYQAFQNTLHFYTPNYRVTRVSGFTSPNILLFDIAEPNDPKIILNPIVEESSNSHNLVLPSARGSIYYATTESAILSPEFVTSNQPSTLSNPTNQGRIVIISHSNWMNVAEQWAEYRRTQGFIVKVVNVEDVFDEFDFGLPTAESIRRFLQHAKLNWIVPPDYVLLLGDATFDPRNFTGNGYNNFIPTMMVDTIFMETGSDEALADFNDDGLAEIPIGRIATRSASVISSVLTKTIAFEQSLNTAFSRGGLFPSDLPQGYDFEEMNNRLIAELPPSIPVTTVNRAASDARERVLNGFNNGPYIVNYAGHGTFAAWAGNMFSRSDVPSLTNTNSNLIIANMLTCLNGYYIEAAQEGLSETLVNKMQGGAVASWASSGLTTPDIQEIMAKRFYQNLRSSPFERIGDLIKDAKTVIPSGRDVRLSWTLLGDPVLKIRNAVSLKD